MKDFFVSYTNPDQPWAEWIAWQLENAGYTTIIQAWDFHAGSNFVSDMQRAATETECTIAVITPAFFTSPYTEAEWTSAFSNDPAGAKRKFLMVRVEDVKPIGLLKTMVYIDLVGLKADEASERLLKQITRERKKPDKCPVFPAKDGNLETLPPRFPGQLSVRVFFILCEFSTDEIKKLLIKQNQKQNIFDIGIRNTDWNSWAGRSNAEMNLKSFQKRLELEAQKVLKLGDKEQRESERRKVLLKFCDEFQTYMTKFDIEHSDFGRPPFNGVNIAVTEMPFPFNYYTWNTKDRNGVVVGIRSLKRLFQEEPQTVNKIIIRVIQRMLVFSLGIKDLKVHKDTKGCLFDFTQELKDIEFSIDENPMPFCGQCRNTIEKDKDSQFLDTITEWIKDSFE
jgi:TIR domain